MILRPDVLGSLALHIGLALLVTLWTPMLRDMDLLDQTLPIEIITIDEFTQLIEDTAKPPDPLDAPEPPQAAVPERAAPEPVAPPQEALPLLEAEKPAEKPPEEAVKETPSRFKVAQPTPFARPEIKPKPLLDIGQARALLNKIPDAPKVQDDRKADDSQALAERLTFSEVDGFRAQMRRCWSPPSGAREAANLVVHIRLSLTPNGMISAGPIVVNRSQLGDPFFRAAAESVLRAIRRCQPFNMPVEKYKSWRDIELTFDPRKMLGS